MSGEKSVMAYLEILFLSQRSYEQRIEILEKKYGIMINEEESKMRKMCTFSDAIWKKTIEKGEEIGISIGRVEDKQYTEFKQNRVASNINEVMNMLMWRLH